MRVVALSMIRGLSKTPWDDEGCLCRRQGEAQVISVWQQISLNRKTMLLRLFAFMLAASPVAADYQKYISEYAGDYLQKFGHSQGAGYQDFIQRYTGVADQQEAQPVSLAAADTSDKQERSNTNAYIRRFEFVLSDTRSYQGKKKILK